MVTRRVVLVCGPPGAGKTTHARSLGLDVYDIDDPQWHNSERYFRSALTQLGQTPGARAAVIRSGATSTARDKAAALVCATETYVLATDAETCVQRVVNRGRPRPPLHVQIAAIKTWWDRYEPATPGIGAVSEAW